VATAKEMKMKMRNGFATVGSVVDDKAVAGLIEL